MPKALQRQLAPEVKPAFRLSPQQTKVLQFVTEQPGSRLYMIREELGIPSESVRTALIWLLKFGLVERRGPKRTLYASPIYPSTVPNAAVVAA